MTQERAYRNSAPNWWPRSLSPVAALFLILFIVLVIPFRIMAIAHGASPGAFTGATISILGVCFLLYRLNVRANIRGWFVVLSIPAVYAAACLAPYLGWCALFVLYLVDCFSRHIRKLLPTQVQPAIRRPPSSAPRGWEEAGQSSQTRFEVVALDSICEPYGRFLFSGRAVRAATASLAGGALVVGPSIVFWFMHDDHAPLRGVLAGSVLTIFLTLACALYFFVLRALWRGSILAACVVLLFSGMAVIRFVLVLIERLQPDLIVSGSIWFYITGLVLQISLVGALAMGSVIIVKRRNDVTFMRILHENRRRDWRTALLQLCGVILPRRPSLMSLKSKSFVLSILAFCIEGNAFTVYLQAPDNLLKFAQSPFPPWFSPVEGHYFSIVTIVCFVLPMAFVLTQMTLRGAKHIRSLAGRASLLSAEEALREDQRPPVLFLRDFKNDQVSLKSAGIPAHVRLFDPAAEQANLEEVLQTCLNIGPVIAIGRPEHLLLHPVRPPIGASRKCVQDERWQEVVLSLMDVASLIVVGVSESEGVSWEIEQLVNRGHCEKSVFVIPPEQCWNRYLVNHLFKKLLRVKDEAQYDRVAVALESKVGDGCVAGVVFRRDTAKVFASRRLPSQVQYDAVLRLAALE
ncbi:MAG: hypothetical protein JO076_05160 [Verrucomicrobia bacterium]|nr:hypothetical protein [Verrucomicrobiota bacterium]